MRSTLVLSILLSSKRHAIITVKKCRPRAETIGIMMQMERLLFGKINTAKFLVFKNATAEASPKASAVFRLYWGWRRPARFFASLKNDNAGGKDDALSPLRVALPKGEP